jgi:hypothetical protein
MHELQASYITVIMSLCTCVILIVGKEVVNPLLKPKLRGVPIPFEIVVVAIGTTCSYFIGVFKIFLKF